MKLPLLTLPILLTLFAAGCSHPDRQAVLVGTWKVRPESVILPILQRYPNMPPDESRARGAEVGAITMEFSADKTFTINGRYPLTGTWALDKTTGVATLTPYIPPPKPGDYPHEAGEPPMITPGPQRPVIVPAVLTATLNDDDSILRVNVPTAAVGTETTLPQMVFGKPE